MYLFTIVHISQLILSVIVVRLLGDITSNFEYTESQFGEGEKKFSKIIQKPVKGKIPETDKKQVLEVNESVSETVICGNCGEEVQSDWEVCWNCNNTLS